MTGKQDEQLEEVISFIRTLKKIAYVAFFFLPFLWMIKIATTGIVIAIIHPVIGSGILTLSLLGIGIVFIALVNICEEIDNPPKRKNKQQKK